MVFQSGYYRIKYRISLILISVHLAGLSACLRKSGRPQSSDLNSETKGAVAEEIWPLVIHSGGAICNAVLVRGKTSQGLLTEQLSVIYSTEPSQAYTDLVATYLRDEYHRSENPLRFGEGGERFRKAAQKSQADGRAPLSKELLSQRAAAIDAAQPGKERHMAFINESLDFVLNQYAARRAWGPEFREKLRQVAEDFRYESVYLTVRDPNSKKIVAALRLVRAPYGRRYKVALPAHPGALKSQVIEDLAGNFGPTWAKFNILGSAFRSPFVPVLGNPFQDLKNYADILKEQQGREMHGRPFLETESQVVQTMRAPRLPMEDLLKITLPRSAEGMPETADQSATGVYWSAGELFEPGNFAVLKEAGVEAKLGLLELFSNFLKSGGSFGIEARKNIRMFTYNDIPKLYTRLGFKIIGNEIIKENVSWKVLEATPETVEESYRQSLAMLKDSLAARDEEKVFSELQDKFISNLERQIATDQSKLGSGQPAEELKSK